MINTATMGQHKPETNNEARLRDARASVEIDRIQQQAQLDQGRTQQNANTRSATAGGWVGGKRRRMDGGRQGSRRSLVVDQALFVPLRGYAS